MTAAEPQDELMKACPYRGLVPYFEDDAEFFFGRESDTRIIVANCLTTRVTLFYGASGVGKSSVLYAGVIRELRRRALANLDRRNCPECAGVAFSSWRDGAAAGHAQKAGRRGENSAHASRRGYGATDARRADARGAGFPPARDAGRDENRALRQ